MSTKPWAIALIIFSTFITATGQFFYKLGADRLPDNLLDISAHLGNWPLMLGLACYAGAAALFIIALRGGELSVIYPFISLGFVWVVLVSVFVLNEPFTLAKGAGIFFILLGVSCIGWGERASRKR